MHELAVLRVEVERFAKCFGVEHRHVPFVCDGCGGTFCRWAENDHGNVMDIVKCCKCEATNG
ncbi:MAG: hypothetical protein ACRD4T_00045 [Candidatus Acidiferrales bacterium]